MAALGYPPPRDLVINSFLGYSSRYYQLPAGGALPWQGLYIQAAPPEHLRGGGIYRVEDGRWLVTLVGMGRDYPPTSDPAFLEFACSLRSPLLYETLQAAEPLSPIAGYRGTENRWRYYERLACWPERFVVVGDAVCAFNPVYGQGMTAATLGAATLAEALTEQRAATRMATSPAWPGGSSVNWPGATARSGSWRRSKTSTARRPRGRGPRCATAWPNAT